jgi:hypothetical protein
MAAFNEKRILGRIWWVMLALVVAGAVGFLFKSAHAAFSFLGGAVVSGLSFGLLQRATSDLAHAVEGVPVKAPRAVVHVLRYALIFGLTYVILGVYGADRAAFVCGLLTSVTAAFVEALLESFYA